MTKHLFVEDLFLEFAKNCLYSDFNIDNRDFSAIDSFYETLSDNKEITKLQADYILRILKKYRLLLKSKNIEFGDLLDNPRWKKPFRILDNSKIASVEANDQGNLCICLKFPFSFKSTFEKDFILDLHQRSVHRWDADKKVNKIRLYDTNVILLHDFLKKHNFVIEDSFLEVHSKIEELWNSQDNLLPHSILNDGSVSLINAPEDAENYWKENKKDIIEHDLLLAKVMGYPLKLSHSPLTIFEKISSSKSRIFWSKRFDDFFSIFKNTTGSAVIMLDRSEGIIDWLSEFVSAADSASVSRSLIKVCFRDDKTEETKINDWIRENHVGGKINEGRVFIFRHKPAKWLFNNKISVNIIATNSLFPMTNMTTQKWMDSHPFVLHLGSIKASQIKENKIVEL